MDLIELLRCPLSKQSLSKSSPEVFGRCRVLWSNRELEQGTLTAVLVTADNETVYPIIDDIPALLPDLARRLPE